MKPKEKNVGRHGILYPHCLKKWGGHVPLVYIHCWCIFIEAKQTQGRKAVDTMRNNLDGDVTESYIINTQFMFECVLCWLALGSIS